mmetsp:Transcript_120632/g.341744  ORF Transcript_120632/g.341744 Transcript_120632/m.341744 type:complete len:332 (+) Transcript_120632:842-1837(+)
MGRPQSSRLCSSWIARSTMSGDSKKTFPQPRGSPVSASRKSFTKVTVPTASAKVRMTPSSTSAVRPPKKTPSPSSFPHVRSRAGLGLPPASGPSPPPGGPGHAPSLHCLHSSALQTPCWCRRLGATSPRNSLAFRTRACIRAAASRHPARCPAEMTLCWSTGPIARRTLSASPVSHFLFSVRKTSSSYWTGSSQGGTPSPISGTSWSGSANRTARCRPSGALTTSNVTGSCCLYSSSASAISGLYWSRNTRLPSKLKDCTWPHPRDSAWAFGVRNQPSIRPAPTQSATGYSVFEAAALSSAEACAAPPLPPSFCIAPLPPFAPEGPVAALC